MSTRNSIRIFLFFLLLSGFNMVKAQPMYSWAKHFTTADALTPTGITVDATGNVYTTGYFSNTADFDPGSGTQLLTSKGSNDLYITKSDASGNLLWAKSIGGDRSVYARSIKADAAGNVYVSGFFRGTVDFDPGAGEELVTGPAVGLSSDAFILKLDASGNYVWAKSLAGGSQCIADAITIDGAGNVYTTGGFGGIVDFDPGTDTHTLNSGGSSSPDIFILKLDASGNYVWAKNIVSNGSVNEGKSIAVDASGNVYTTGSFSGTSDFDPGTAVANLSSGYYFDIFILKLTAAGDYEWARSVGTNTTEAGTGIAVDGAGNVYTTGYFYSILDFDPGADVHELTPTGPNDAYILKLNAAGNYVWAVNVADGGDDVSIALDNLNNVYVTGEFGGTVDFDPGSATHNLTAAGGQDAFFLKLDASGAYQWATGIGSSDSESAKALAVAGNDDIYAVGTFIGTVDFDPGSGVKELTAVDGGAYILHLVPSTVPLTLLNFTVVDKGTVVQLQWETSQEENTALFTIERSADGKQYEAIGSVTAVNNHLVNNYSFTDAQPLTGNSFYRLKMIDQDARFTNSRIVAVTRQHRSQPLQVKPNPANNILYVQANGMETTVLQITDAAGRIWQQQKLKLNGKTFTSVNINALPAGVYYLLIKGKQIQQVQQFVKQ